MRKIPRFHKHDLQLSDEGVGSRNNKEYCLCENCKKLRERRDKIFNSIIHRFNRWYNLNF
jgi:hypothetical protein